MSGRDDEIAAVMAYMRGHWPSEVREEWQLQDGDYKEMLARVIREWTLGASRGRRFYRVAGQSGSGKTTQLLPAVEVWFRSSAELSKPTFSEPSIARHGQNHISSSGEDSGALAISVAHLPESTPGADVVLTGESKSSEKVGFESSPDVQRRPVLVAARRFVEYHPYINEITAEYGVGEVRRMTDEVSTVMMFLTLRELIREGYDIILDVTLLDPVVEGVLVGMLKESQYEARMSLVAVSKEISDEFIAKRKGSEGRVVAKSTADEFWRVMDAAFLYYAKNWPDMRVTLWSAWDLAPVYDGAIGDKEAFEVLKKYHKVAKMPGSAPSEKELLAAKMRWVREKG